MKPVMTRHALERSKERIGLDRRASERLAGIAFVKGLVIDDLRGELKRVARLILSDSHANHIRIYAEKIFLFLVEPEAIVLITVLPLENKYKESARKSMRAKEKELEDFS
jgi:hypothetical protein